mmetsp:Transcript_24646/g.28072  ORF Transcript_24646/g.28072 Transcript_24646/m.28072 type:complete len:252 (+) Transcript_24646:630-1385(+)
MLSWTTAGLKELSNVQRMTCSVPSIISEERLSILVRLKRKLQTLETQTQTKRMTNLAKTPQTAAKKMRTRKIVIRKTTVHKMEETRRTKIPAIIQQMTVRKTKTGRSRMERTMTQKMYRMIPKTEIAKIIVPKTIVRRTKIRKIKIQRMINQQIRKRILTTRILMVLKTMVHRMTNLKTVIQKIVLRMTKPRMIVHKTMTPKMIIQRRRTLRKRLRNNVFHKRGTNYDNLTLLRVLSTSLSVHLLLVLHRS